MFRMLIPTLVFVCALGLYIAEGSGMLALPQVGRIMLIILLWLASTFLIARIVVAVTRWGFLRKTEHPPPRLLGDMISLICWLLGICSLAVVEFGVSPTAAVATSGVMIAVVGFAVRSLVADLFYGITMAIDRPFEIGDWVHLSDGTKGRVVEMTWRAVKLITRENLKLIVPNTKLAVEQIANYDQPEPYWRKTLNVLLGYDVKPDQVKQMLAAAVAEVPESASLPRPPEALMIDLNEQGITWELRYWLPDFESAAEVGQKVREAFLRNMVLSGVHVPRRREEVYLGRLDEEREQEQVSSARWIDQIALFANAPEEVRTALQSSAQLSNFEPGASIVTQGEPGSSLFVIQHGTCDVIIGEEGNAEKVGAIGAGSVFGELSLLTGAPRSATVRTATATAVFEISKANLAPVLEVYPDLATDLATVLADMRIADARRNQLRSQAQLDAERAGLIASLVDGAKSFFRMSA